MDAQEMLPLMDRLIQPITARLDHMDQRQREDTVQLHTKIDGLSSIAHTAAAAHSAAQDLSTKVDGLIADINSTKTELAETRGRNAILSALMLYIGAPILVILAAGGIASLFGVDLSGGL